MSQSTPINQIRRTDPSTTPSIGGGDMNSQYNSSNSESQLVEDILKEMGNSPGNEQQSNINSQSFQYAMDSSQVPAYKYNEPSQPTPPYDSYAEKMMHQQNTNTGLLSQIGINLSGSSLKDKIVKNLKYPGLVFVLCFIISLPEFNRFLFSFFPKLLLESGQVTIGGVLLKAVLGMIIFAIIAFFI
jgi:hypothetical protein